MNHFKLTLVSLFTLACLFLNACTNSPQEKANTTSTTTAPFPSPSAATKDKDKKDGHSHGGQIVESGQYHLELVTEKEDQGIHLHFHLEKGEKHEPVGNAKVTAQVQLPDGSQKNIDFQYDAKEKVYAANMPSKPAGQYQLKLTANIGSEQVNGRFTVSQ
jgi:hypothetical protein